VVAEGETVAVPDAGNPVPTPLSMLTELACVELHVNVELPPGATEFGDAVNVTVGAVADTVIVTCASLVPPEPAAVAV
jgi:hypothetical protein